MTEGAFDWEDATALAALLASKKVSATNLMRLSLERIARLNPTLNAIVALDEPGALEAARESERRQLNGTRLGPLDGIPVTVKDNLFADGFRATWGSRVYERHEPSVDDIVVERLRAAAAIVVGKTNTPEFALNNETTNLVFGTTVNPWDPRLTPGGSSGGASASVAAALAPLAIGTDAGGSIRQPAAFTGVVGLKPTIGRVPRAYGFPPTVADFQVIGLMARSLRDVALLFSVTGGADPRDRTSLAFAKRDFALRSGPARTKMLVVTEFGGQAVDPEIHASVEHAAAAFSEMGHDVERRALPFDMEPVYELWRVLSDVGVARILQNAPQPLPELSDGVAAAAARGARITAAAYVAALDRLAKFRLQVAQHWSGFASILTPVTASMPWPAEPAEQSDEEHPADLHLSIFRKLANATGYPAIAFPGQPARSGLPIGVQLMAHYGEEELLLSLAAQFEARNPWADRRPVIS